MPSLATLWTFPELNDFHQSCCVYNNRKDEQIVFENEYKNYLRWLYGNNGFLPAFLAASNSFFSSSIFMSLTCTKCS